MKTQKHIEIIRSTTKGLSSMSQRSCDAILATLRSKYARVGVSIVNTPADLEKLTSKQPDLVFIGMKYVLDDQGEKLWVSEFLSKNDILHTGSDKFAIEHEQSKPKAKNRVKEYGVPTARFLVAKLGKNIENTDLDLSFPLFVKPTSLGGGAGVDGESYIHTQSALNDKVTQIHNVLNTDALVEEYLPGREFSVAILRSPGTEELIAMPIEIAAPKNISNDPILSQEVKLSNQEIILPVTEHTLRTEINTTALQAFNALNGRDYGRIDIRLDKSGVAHFLEANLIPSLISGYGSFPKACMLNANIGFHEMIHIIVDLALERQTSDETIKLPFASPVLYQVPTA